MQARALSAAVFSVAVIANAHADDAGNPKIPDGAYMPLSKESAPKLYKAWGKKGIERINVAVKSAIEATAASDKCDTVFTGGYSFDRSEPKDHFSVFVDCLNGERFYFTEEEAVAAETAPSSESEWIKATSDSDALRSCEDIAKSQLQFPSTMDASWFSSNVNRTNFGISVTLVFEAKNGLGATLPYVAYCTLDKTKVHLQSIKER